MKKERNIGDNIRLLRKVRGLSLKYMAEMLSITQHATSFKRADIEMSSSIRGQ